MGGRLHQRPKRRAALSLAIAVLLHGSAALWLLNRHVRRSEPTRIELTLIEKQRPPKPAAPPVVDPLPEQSKKNPPAVRRGLHGPKPKDVARGETPSDNGKSAGHDHPPPQPPTAPAVPPVAEQPPSTDPKDVRLFDHDALASRLGKPGPFSQDHGTVPNTLQGGDNSPAAEKKRVTEAIEGGIAEQQATERVEMGLVDPYFRQLAKATNGEWKLKPRNAGGPEETNQIQDLQALVTRWFGVGKAYGKSGNPHAGDGTVPTPDNTHPIGRDLNAQDVAEFNAHWDTGRGFYLGGLLVLELTQNRQGDPLNIRLLKSSGNAELDASAKKAVTLAAKQRLAPEHGLGLGGSYIFSLWKMEARVVPGGCSFIPDATGKTGDQRFVPTSVQCGNNFDMSAEGVTLEGPLIQTPFGLGQPKQRNKVITNVELLAVYGGETAPVQPAKPELK